MIKRISSYIETLAHHKHSEVAVFLVALTEAFFSPVLPEALIVAILAYKKSASWLRLSLISTLGSTLGGIGMFFIGMFLYDTVGAQIVTHYGWQATINQAQTMFVAHAFITLVIAAFTPLPDKIFNFAAGIFSVNFFIFVPAITIGRFVRVALIGYLTQTFGVKVKDALLRQADIVLYVLLAAVLVGAYFVMR